MIEITKEELELLYLKEGWSQIKCAKFFNVKTHVIKARLKWFDIKIREHSLSGRRQTEDQVKKRVKSTQEKVNLKTKEEKEEIKKKIALNSRSSDPNVKRKNSIAHKGKKTWNKGKKLPQYSGENHYNYGKSTPEHVKEAIRSAALGRKQSPELIEKRISPLRGRNRPEEVRRKIKETNLKTWSLIEVKEKVMGKNNPNYQGYCSRGLCSYEKYSSILFPFEETRESSENIGVLEVKCTYCGQWMVPSNFSVSIRLRFINGSSTMEGRFYCSNECKRSCPIFHKIKYPRGYKKATSREVNPELRKEVFKRDEWTCQKCGSNESLHCHHIEGAFQQPMLSNDPENCITLCKKCHKWVHSKEGCRYYDYRCNK